MQLPAIPNYPPRLDNIYKAKYPTWEYLEMIAGKVKRNRISEWECNGKGKGQGWGNGRKCDLVGSHNPVYQLIKMRWGCVCIDIRCRSEIWYYLLYSVTSACQARPICILYANYLLHACACTMLFREATKHHGC